MNIGIVCYPTYGGSGVVATELGKELAKRGNIIHFITYNRPVRLTSFTQNVYYHQVTPQNYPLFEHVPYESALASKIVDVALFHSLDLLHVHYAIPHASSAYLAQQILQNIGYKLPFVTTLHGTDVTLVGRDASYGPVIEFSINKSNGVTSVSEYLKKVTYDNFNIDREIDVIYNFVDLARFSGYNKKKELRQCLANCEEKILIHASNFRKVKRIFDVYEIFKRVNSKLNSKLVLIGDGPDRDELENKVRKEGFCNKVVFPGNQESIEEILPLGDVFIFPSENESFGLAALEAMACGLPVIGTHSGGLPELVENGKSGYLSPIGNVDEMADNTVNILSSPERYLSFIENAVKRAADFSKDKIIESYEKLYTGVIESYQPENKHRKIS